MAEYIPKESTVEQALQGFSDAAARVNRFEGFLRGEGLSADDIATNVGLTAMKRTAQEYAIDLEDAVLHNRYQVHAPETAIGNGNGQVPEYLRPRVDVGRI